MSKIAIWMDQAEIENDLARIKSASRAARSFPRFDQYSYLEEIYRTYCYWKKRSMSRRMTHALARARNVPIRADHHPLRILIQLTNGKNGPQLASRWTRALEYAHSRKVRFTDLIAFLKSHGGIAGCARRAAETLPKRPRRIEDWDDIDDDY